MSVLSGFLEHVGRLVHPSAQPSDLDRARHRMFLTTRFGLCFAALLGWVVALALGHVPGPWEAMVVAWFAVPFVAATFVSRTGSLVNGEVACLAAWIGLALTITMGGGASLLGGCILLAVAPLEAAFSGRLRLVAFAALAAVLGMVVLLGLQRSGLMPVARNPIAGDALLAIPALAYIVVLAVCSLALQRRGQSLVAVGEERYRALSEAIGDLVLRYDLTGGVVMASREAETLFGIAPRDLLGRGFFERVHVADRPAFLKVLADASDMRATLSVRLRLRTSLPAPEGNRPSDPVFVWIELRAKRLEPVAGRPARRREDIVGEPAIVALVRDISSQVAHEQAIQEAKAEAERLNLWKDGFIANVSHELRTPLNAIIGFSEMLARDDLTPRDPEKQRDYARIITTSGHHLLSVVNTLLDISKIEAGRFDLNPEPFAIAPMIESCCDMMGLKAEQAGVALHRDVAPLLDEIVCDKRACKQIVINLLSNAVKFTQSGGAVSIAARPEGAMMLLTVADTGVGIAPMDLMRLGDAFFQAKSGHDRPFEGTGLGLSVVRGLVGLHGGSIAIASSPGEGTVVSVRLPLDCRVVEPKPGAAKIETFARYNRGLTPLRLSPAAKVHKVA